MTRFFFYFLGLVFLISCKAKINQRDQEEAKQLCSEGMKIIKERNLLQPADSNRAKKLNQDAIEKFSAAYKADTSFRDAVLLASECTMYSEDYQNCFDWTTKLMHLDTSQWIQRLCKKRIQICKRKLDLGYKNRH